jgi:hypothetical protein
MIAAAASVAAAADLAARVDVERNTWDMWIPPYATHVEGKWTRRVVNEEGFPEPQKVEMTCSQCGASWKTVCTSGLVHGHIQKFALVHLHRDVFNVTPRILPEDK